MDGSLLTEKIDPRDADLVLVIAENFERHATEEQMGIWDWWDDSSEPKDIFRCHVFTVAKIPASDPYYSVYISQEARWRKWFGTSRQGRPKGIARILLPDGCA